MGKMVKETWTRHGSLQVAASPQSTHWTFDLYPIISPARIPVHSCTQVMCQNPASAVLVLGHAQGGCFVNLSAITEVP